MVTRRPSINKQPLHEHPLFHTAMFTLSECALCHLKGDMYGSYFCDEVSCRFVDKLMVSCRFRLHKECAEAPLEINHHPSHPEHSLLLTNDSPTKDGTCDFCGQKLLSTYYTCLTCEFKLDFICGIKPSPSAIEHPVCHDHPLVFLKRQGDETVQCDVCKKSIDGGPSYSCPECNNNLYFHLDCIRLSKEVNHPCHPNHPLKITACESLNVDDAEMNCRFCSVELENMMYHCSICNFTVCLGCTKTPPPLVVDHPKTHNHLLRLVSSILAFTCKVCGIEGYQSKPYICLECDFVIHGNCIGFPQVININRHDHRISFTYHHGRGGRCGVCRRNVSQYCGAYSCTVCRNYIVHTDCALTPYVWNFVDLEGIPEESEDIAPFKVVGHISNIRHFSHSQHTLRLFKYNDAFIRCEACLRLVGSYDPIYSCTDCCFVLHQKCANLPLKKRLPFDPAPYTLESCSSSPIYCSLCGMLNDGFRYTSQGVRLTYHYVDIHCGSLSEPFFHNAHSHPLYFLQTDGNYCDACKRVPADYMLFCDTCSFFLCLYCATLPEEIRHMSDEHPLTLYSSGKGNGTSWCEVCEVELDPNKWFFTCSDCEVAVHVQCVLGDFSRLMLESLHIFGEREYKVVLNNHYTRPFCSYCHSRCKVPFILKEKSKDNGYICSLSCLSSCLGIKFGQLPRTEM